MKLFSILAIGLTLLSCGSTKDVTTTETVETTPSKPERNIMITAEIGDSKASEPFKIHSVRVEGNLLFVDVSFVGGCGVHNFKAIGSQAIMKSLPAKRSLVITHEVPREECDDTVKKVLEIEMSALAEKQSPGSTIILLLEGWDDEIKYVFE